MANTQDLRTINRIKSMYGFFFAGLKLGSDGYKVGEEGEEVNMEEDRTTPTCKKVLSRHTAPFSGTGVEVRFKRGKTQKKIHTFFYWEFIIYGQKVLIIAMIAFMGDSNEGYQISFIFFLMILFIALQYVNQPYYTNSLNSMQYLQTIMILVYIAIRMIIRSIGAF